MPIPHDVYSDALTKLYAAAVDDSKWRTFLSQLCELTQSSYGLLFTNDSTLGNRPLASAGLEIPETLMRSYLEGFSFSDPVRKAFMKGPRTGVIEIDDLVPSTELRKTAFFQSILQPLGLSWGTIIVPAISPRRYELISLYRQKGGPHLDRDLRDFVTALFPHIQNAFTIRSAFGRLEDRLRSAETLLNTSLEACALLDNDGRLVYMNSSAQKLASAEDGFRVKDDYFQPVDPSKRRVFSSKVKAAASAQGNRSHTFGTAVSLARPGDKRPLQILISPFIVEAAHRTSARVLILATDPERRVAFPDAVLRQLYELTPAETEIANGLLTGLSLDEMATVRRVSVLTIRSQVKSMLAKTSTNRQADLLRLLMTLPRPLSKQMSA